MKLLYSLVFILLSSSIFAQSGIVWEPAIVVANNAAYGNVRPRATVLDGDRPVVIYGKSGTENLFISRWNGSDFGTPISILPAGMSPYISNWTGPDIDSKGDTIVAVFKVDPIDNGNVYSVRSTDGGFTFSDTIRVDSHDTGVAWMPSMGMDNNGNPVVVYMAHDASWTNPRYVRVTSTDAGMTYTFEEEIANAVPGEACDCCPAEMIVKDDRQVLLFRNNESNVRDVYGVLSIDGGTTFPYASDIDQLNWFVNSCPSVGMDGVFGSDNLYMTYSSAESGAYRVYLSNASTVGGLTLDSQTSVIAPDMPSGFQNNPRISGTNDTIVMVWEETSMGNQEVFCSVVTPGYDPMVSLTSFKAIANEVSTGTQNSPEVVYKNGFVHLFYSDVFTGDLVYRRGTIDIVAGLNEMEQEVRIYPNPSNGTFEIEGSIDVVGLTDLNGKNVHYHTEQDGTSTRIRLLDATPGIYLLRTSANLARVIKLAVK